MSAVSDSAYKTGATDQGNAMVAWATVDAAIMTALALYKRSTQTSIANMQEALAKRQVALAEKVHEHAKQFWPYEIAFVNDMFGIAKTDPPYTALSASWADFLDKSHQAYRSKLVETLNDRCVYLTACETANWNRNRQADRASIISFADRQAEGRADTMDDYRFAWQYAALGLGNGVLSDVSSYQQLAGIAGSNARGLLWDSINNGLEAFGFYRRGTDRWGDRITSQWGLTSEGESVKIPYEVPQTRTESLYDDNGMRIYRA